MSWFMHAWLSNAFHALLAVSRLWRNLYHSGVRWSGCGLPRMCASFLSITGTLGGFRMNVPSHSRGGFTYLKYRASQNRHSASASRSNSIVSNACMPSKYSCSTSRTASWKSGALNASGLAQMWVSRCSSRSSIVSSMSSSPN